MNFTKAMVVTIFGVFSMQQVNPLTKNEVLGYSVVGGAAGCLVGYLIYVNCSDTSDSAKPWRALGVGGVVGGVTGLITYAFLSQYTSEARFERAQSIVRSVSRAPLVRNAFETDDELFAFANRTFNVRWPIALAHESCVDKQESLNQAEDLLDLAIRDTTDQRLLEDIETLAEEVEPLSDIIEEHVRALQTHRQYEVQAVLLEGHRREERMEKEAQRRHDEAMLQQAALMRQQKQQHDEAMRQQRKLLHAVR